MFMIYFPIELFCCLIQMLKLAWFFLNYVIEWRVAHKELSISYRMFVVRKQFYDCLYFLNHGLLI